MLIVPAEYELPHHLWVDYDVLGSRFETNIGPVRATVVTPPDPRTSTYAELQSPDLPGVPPSAWEPDTPWTTKYASSGTRNATALRRIGLELREDGHRLSPMAGYAQDEKIFYHATNWIAYWFAQVENWASVITGDDINHRQPTYSANTNGPGLRMWRSGQWQDGGFRLTTPHHTPIPAEFFRAILERVADGEQPPVEHQLWRDSRAALIRGDHRKAVLDAATAVESCLIAEIAEVESQTGLNYPVKRGRGLKSRSEWLEKQTSHYHPHPDLPLLADCRNEVIHAGGPVEYEAASTAVEVAITTVLAYGRSYDPRRPLATTAATPHPQQ
ncbi:hypothetical protein [Nocardia sp. NPDC003963]